MVDGIKARGTPPQPEPSREGSRATSSQRSTESLKQSFKSIGANLSVAENLKAAPKDKPKKSENRTPRLGGSLEDAVKFSREALKVLEDVTAGTLSSSNVQGLLSEDVPPREVQQIPRPESFEPIRELAEDLNALRADLKNLFESLKQNATKSDVLSENFQAAEVEASDLEVALEKAEATSLEIQYNSRDALEAHKGLTADSVAKLLDPEADR